MMLLKIYEETDVHLSHSLECLYWKNLDIRVMGHWILLHFQLVRWPKVTVVQEQGHRKHMGAAYVRFKDLRDEKGTSRDGSSLLAKLSELKRIRKRGVLG